jgi:hypothetical protein
MLKSIAIVLQFRLGNLRHHRHPMHMRQHRDHRQDLLLRVRCMLSSRHCEYVGSCPYIQHRLIDLTATTKFASQLCKIQNINVNTMPSCPSGLATSSGDATSTSSRTGSASVAESTGAAPLQSAGAGLSLGLAMVGLLAAM